MGQINASHFEKKPWAVKFGTGVCNLFRNLAYWKITSFLGQIILFIHSFNQRLSGA